MKYILVTGANGQLGKSIQELEDNFPELNFDFKNSKDLDITSVNQVQTIFSNNNYNYCINCAAYTNVEQAEKKPEIAFKVNAEGVKNLAESCVKNNTILIHISTDYVFDGEKEEAYLTTDTPNPINEYGKSKLLGEKYIQEILEKYFIIRTSWLYSEFKDNFVKKILSLGKEKNELTIVCDQIGSPTYAGDLAELIIKVILKDSINFGIYHFSNEGITSWYDYAKYIFELKNVNCNILSVYTNSNSELAKRPLYSVMDKCKIKLKFNIEILSWKDSLKTYLEKIEIM